MKPIEFHHTAYRVVDMDRSVQRWVEVLGAQVEMPSTPIAADSVRVCFLKLPFGRIELVEPMDGSTPEIAPAPSGRPDHICFLCRDFDDQIEKARLQSAIVVRPPAPSPAFGGKRMCFVLYRDLGLVEWVEK